MKKSKFHHPFAYDPLLVGTEKVDGRSQTVPGRALSIAEIMHRSAGGIPLPASSGLEYGDDEDFNHAFETDDPLIDAAEAANRTAALRKQVDDQRKAAQDKLRQETPKVDKPKQEEPTVDNPNPSST